MPVNEGGVTAWLTWRAGCSPDTLHATVIHNHHLLVLAFYCQNTSWQFQKDHQGFWTESVVHGQSGYSKNV